MIEDLFDHTCDIYHGTQETQARGYGLPDKEADHFVYPESPDIEACPCHFGGNINPVQGEPGNILDGGVKLALPAGTDIRVNDRVVSGVTGYAYRAGIPRDIRGHHVAVWVERIHPRQL
jgi:hypothetical protein